MSCIGAFLELWCYMFRRLESPYLEMNGVFYRTCLVAFLLHVSKIKYHCVIDPSAGALHLPID